jgi:hypothetical protein
MSQSRPKMTPSPALGVDPMPVSGPVRQYSAEQERRQRDLPKTIVGVSTVYILLNIEFRPTLIRALSRKTQDVS